MPSTATSARDLRVDSIRGGLLLVMAVNHIASDLRLAIDQPFGFVSAAEGFVFLSGLLVGWVYGKKLATLGPQETKRACWRRAVQVYAWHLAGVIGTWVWCWLQKSLTGEAAGLLPPLFIEQPVMSLVSGALLLYQPGLLDILPLYVGFMAVAPWVLRACANGNWRRVLLISGTVWAADQTFSPPHPIIWGSINTGAFHFLSWQFLFVSGAVIGHQRLISPRPSIPQRPWLLGIVMLAAVFLWVVRQPWLPDWWDHDDVLVLTNKTPLAPLRLINFGLIAYLIASSAHVFPKLFSWRPLAFLGRHSLAAFTGQTLLAAVILTWPETGDDPHWRWFNTGFVIVGLYVSAAGQAWVQSRRKNQKQSRNVQPLTNGASASVSVS
ncbi:MAG: OpgC domain-containing protein [Nibricoccus sp.]